VPVHTTVTCRILLPCLTLVPCLFAHSTQVDIPVYPCTHNCHILLHASVPDTHSLFAHSAQVYGVAEAGAGLAAGTGGGGGRREVGRGAGAEAGAVAGATLTHANSAARPFLFRNSWNSALAIAFAAALFSASALSLPSGKVQPERGVPY